MNRRPTSLIVVSVVWFFIGGWQLLSASLQIANLIATQIAVGSSSMPSMTTPLFAAFIVGGWVLLLLQWSVGALVAVSAYYLWMLRSWARKTLELVSWVSLVLWLCGGIFWLYMFLELTSRLPHAVRSSYDWMSWLSLGVVTSVCVALGACIRALRGPAIRGAVAPSPSAPTGEDALTPSARRYVIPSVPS